MKNSAGSRKEFIKEIAKLLGNKVVEPFTSNKNIYELNDEQKEFLVVYRAWLNEFESFIREQNKNPQDKKNNKRLMELSDQAAEWKKHLEEFMEDAVFATVFYDISSELSAQIK